MKKLLLIITLTLIFAGCTQNFNSTKPTNGSLETDSTGNFQLLISDVAPVDFDDFERIVVNLSYAEVRGVEEVRVDVNKSVDLRQVQGERAIPVAYANLPPGEYERVILHVRNVHAVLVNNESELADMSAGNLQINKPFEIEANKTTRFVFDVRPVQLATEDLEPLDSYRIFPNGGNSGVIGEHLNESEVEIVNNTGDTGGQAVESIPFLTHMQIKDPQVASEYGIPGYVEITSDEDVEKLEVGRGDKANVTFNLHFVSYGNLSEVKVELGTDEGVSIEQRYVVLDEESNVVERRVLDVNQLVNYNKSMVYLKDNQTVPVTATVSIPDLPKRISPSEFPLGSVGISSEVPVISHVNIDVIINASATSGLDLANLTSEEVIDFALRYDEFGEKYRHWEFNVTEKRLVERDGKEMLYVDLWAHKGEWEHVIQVWFYLNENGELVDQHVYPYVKTTHPRGVSPQEREEMLSLALNDSEVREVIAGKDYNVSRMVKFVNPFTDEEKFKEMYVKINNSPLSYVITIKENIVSIENTTCPSGEGFCYGAGPSIR
ncbi:MAG: DUF4382 domain-containing protein [Archaeoglobaceae archaeon]